MSPRRGIILLGLLACGCAGAGGARVEPPALSPSDAAQKAIESFDANRDSLLDAAELEKCPSIKSALARFDADSDNKLSAKEIEKRLRMYQESQSGITMVPCRVLLNGMPLRQATVVFEPEAFLGSSFRPATGTTDDNGAAALRSEGYDLDGLPYGLFRVKVSLKQGGRETIPARYNEQTTLGQEISPDMRGDIVIQLTSR